MLNLAPQPAIVSCGLCTAQADSPDVGLPEGWEGAFARGEWAIFCPRCAARPEEPMFAVLRPAAGEVALFIGPIAEMRTVALTIPEARQLHATLGQALKLAEHPGILP
jgi:hypothetical protein